jgi:hypothetical protein
VSFVQPSADHLTGYEPCTEAETYARFGFLDSKKAAPYVRSQLAEAFADPNKEVIGAQDEAGHLVGVMVMKPKAEDSAALGYRIGTVDHVSLRRTEDAEQRKTDASLLLNVCAQRLGGRYDMATLLIDMGEHALLEALQEHGAHVFGCNAKWVCPMERLAPGLLDAAPRFNEQWYQPEDRERLIQCIEACFRSYRSHYHADSRLPAQQSGVTYLRAVLAHADAGGALALISDPDDETLLGFVTMEAHDRLNEFLGEPILAELVIGGVVPRARSQGMYEATLVQGLRWIRDQGSSHVLFCCSSDNYPVQSTWIRLGAFRPKQVQYRMHWWLAS